MVTVPDEIKEEVKSELDTALSEVAIAEAALDAILGKLRAVRAEKVTITGAVEEAFSRLRESRESLAKLKALVDEDDA